MTYWVHRITEAKGQYRITLPKGLVESLAWRKGDVVMLTDTGKGQVLLELVAVEVKFEGGISKRKDGSR